MSLTWPDLEPLPGFKGGLVLLGLWIALAAAAAWLAPFDPWVQDPVRLLQPPGAVHWLGTDQLGRDLLSRIIHGARMDLALSVLGVLAPLAIGSLLGMLAGMAGGGMGGPGGGLGGGPGGGPGGGQVGGLVGRLAGSVLDRLIDLVEAFPPIVLILAVVAALGGDLRSFYLALAVVGWPAYASATRRQWRHLRRSAFVAAGRGLGLGMLRIHLRHILPNALTPALAHAPGDVLRILLIVMALGYFGIGLPAESLEWGALIAAGQSQMALGWWLPLFPGIAALSLALGLNWLAEGVAARLAAPSDPD
jgi:peptide/nickel transport system permease protein